MKVIIRVLARKQILNPADNAIKKLLHQMGYGGIQELRLGKFIEFEVDNSRTAEEWKEFFNLRCKDLRCRDPRLDIANPLSDEWEIEVCQ